MSSDWIVETQCGMGGLSPDVTKAIDALPETGAVTPLRYATPRSIDGSGVDVAAFDPATWRATSTSTRRG